MSHKGNDAHNEQIAEIKQDIKDLTDEINRQTNEIEQIVYNRRNDQVRLGKLYKELVELDNQD